MYRRGPSKATPANVQCQKCLKRGHYSYECKASAQERPYIPRPSRTQQLLNPKLIPKLASDTPDALSSKKGVADEELAKLEAERARKRELERADEDSDDGKAPARQVLKRRRAASFDSVSTISTGRSPSPPPARKAPSSSPLPSRRSESRSPPPLGRAESYDSVNDDERPTRPQSSKPRQLSPPINRRSRSRSLSDDFSPARQEDRPRLSRRDSPSRSLPRRQQRRFRSRSSRGHRQPPRSPSPRVSARGSRGRDIEDNKPSAPPPRREPRERSLSPFSRRLALTQAMNTGR
ncbi:zinc knuckle-domain-containing protein [Pseudomassariella vexata]|uniref:Zinc knuckle-domain-containing protein n=1 Tax=Pseudomassariella vexata TaxID=1141098 RepID=A0A1Y2DJZ2_9PEZI|nr:zinc knuckle-domain-containing protein [Pseudomassariella vexata]ORY59568.1 zinc knuckle-domain-containing protein [Pseudomassariella vexata]